MNAMPYHEAAEHHAAAHMRALGYRDARATKRGSDGGLDVVANGAVAQVKTHVKTVGAPDLQRLYGARGVHHHRKMLFYSLSGYSPKAVAYAQTAEIMLFRLELDGSATPENENARKLVKLAASTAAAQNASDSMTSARQEAARRIAAQTPAAKAEYERRNAAERASW
ncbi:restriction endonuclease [Nocardia sp. NPDC004568]|uniref:restriction endonuclease n=1 Tax=Nocardia sp. NPDC004568 TaxID=3154551 RepID=UPI0033B93D2B